MYFLLGHMRDPFNNQDKPKKNNAVVSKVSTKYFLIP